MAFVIFIALASVGYLIYLFSPPRTFVFLGLGFAMAWSGMASPAIFAVIGDSLPKERRAMDFSVLSILKRIPVVIAPIIGGVLIAGTGVVTGIRTGLIITLILAVIAVLIIFAVNIPIVLVEPTNVSGVWRSFRQSPLHHNYLHRFVRFPE